jgi:hypothetical protein
VKRIDEIRERLAKATPGPWYLDDEGSHFTLHNPFDRTEDGEVTADIFCCTREDANLLANSRADLEWAVAEIERLRKLVSTIDVESEL